MTAMVAKEFRRHKQAIISTSGAQWHLVVQQPVNTA